MSKPSTFKPTTKEPSAFLQTPFCDWVCYNHNRNMFNVMAKKSISIKLLMIYIGSGSIAEVGQRQEAMLALKIHLLDGPRLQVRFY
jgi:hypothetical protein